MLSKLGKTVHFVDIDIKIVRMAGSMIEAVAAFTNRNDENCFQVIVR